MSTLWWVIIGVAATTLVLRGAGPALLRDREFPPRVAAVIDRLAPALLAGLIVVDLAGARWSAFAPDVLPGLAVAAALKWRGATDILCLLAAVVVTVLVRLVPLG